MSDFNNRTFIVKQIRVYNLCLIIQYLLIRYKVFVREFKKPIIGEFDKYDLVTAKHYIFLKGKQKIGTVRVTYKNDTAVIGRVALLKEYRNQGYGTKLLNQLIANIKIRNEATLISLFTESKNIKFYQKFGFIENGEVFFDNIPYINMKTLVNK